MAVRISAAVTPTVGTAGEWGTWRVRCLVEEGELAAGDRLLVALPHCWHAWQRNSAKGVHSLDPAQPNYVAAYASRPAVMLTCTVPDGSTEEYEKRTRPALVGPPNRCAYTTVVTVTQGTLRPGDWVDVVYGDRSGGSPGFTAALHPNGLEPVRIAVEPQEGPRRLLPDEESPLLVTRAAEPVEIVATAPSQVRVGLESAFHLVALDRWQNAATGVALACAVEVREGKGQAPAPVVIDPDTGRCHVPFKPLAPGLLRFALRSADGTFVTETNPILCVEELGEGVFWGDLHSHAGRSFDGTGAFPFAYAREVACLDFYALTEHVEQLGAADWDAIRTAAHAHNEPGRFVTLLGYEATFPSPWAHHNVYFRDDGDVRIGAHNGTVRDLWDALTPGEAMTIPHHTGVRFSPKASNLPGGTGPNIDWRYRDDRFRRLIEVYSGHGLCEYYNPDHPLAYQHCDFSLNDSVPGPHYAQDGWLAGQRLGTICSSDNHQAQPGKRQMGLAAVWAPRLTRSAIFTGLHERATYGTTGSRILLRCWVNDVSMGGETPAGEGVSVRVWAVGTAEIAWVEVLRGDLEAGRFDVVYRQEPGRAVTDFIWHDPQPVRRALYYVRLRQAAPVAGRVAQAWSSPVWVG